jgi:LysR family transcriptional regulator for bpeEF and oprC
LKNLGWRNLLKMLYQSICKGGTLVEVLSDWQPPSVPVTLRYPHQRFLSPAVRAFADWIAGII